MTHVRAPGLTIHTLTVFVCACLLPYVPVAAFVAARDIDVGEELRISYLDQYLPWHIRQQHLLFAYGFKCGCTRCVEEQGDQGAGLP